METTWNGSLRASYLYGYDLEGRRLAENVTGPIATKFVPSYPNGFIMEWTYTAKSQILSSEAYELDAFGNKVEELDISAWERTWSWDDFSNRTFENRSGSSDTTYSPDSLNQYDSISGHLAEPGIDYDDDGNLSVDGTWSYTYDLEDRVVTMTRTGVSMTFTYDYLGRRVRKVASGASCGAPGTYEYVYDGFNLLVIYKNDTRFETYTWGLDKTGTLHGAGGVGGLLMMRGGNAVFPVYDARGNVTGYINSSDGVLYRAYQFDAFGNPVAFVLDPGISTRDFVGFASKLTDIDGDPGADAGLVNFGLRLYQPKHGRFIHRDPIGEAGGENLYAHTWNDPVNRWDYLGMQAVDRPPPPDPRFPPIYLPEPPLRDDFPIPNYPGPDVPAPPPWSHWTWADANTSHRETAANSAKQAVRIRTLEEAHRRARDLLLEKAQVSSANDEDSVLIRVRTDVSGTYYVLSEVIEGDPNHQRAHISARASRTVVDDRTVVGVAHVHPSSERGRLSGTDIREGIRTGISISAVAVGGVGRGEAEVIIPPNTRGNVPVAAREYVEQWKHNYKQGQAETFERGGQDRRFVNAPPGLEMYVPPGSIIVIDNRQP